MVRLKHSKSLMTSAKLGDVWPEVVFRNSHDGTTKFHAQAGVFRLACLNGLVVADGKSTGFDALHNHASAGLLIDGTTEDEEEVAEAVQVNHSLIRDVLFGDLAEADDAALGAAARGEGGC
jgi:hypothetical protein